MISLEKLKYPVGKYTALQSFEAVTIPLHITNIAALPEKLRKATGSLNNEQLDTPYRENGWTIRQVIHHLADSHINSYCRFKLAMTEDNPVIKPYLEDKWANFDDARTAAIDYSLNIIEAVHGRWVLFLKTMDTHDFKKTFFHPEHQRVVSLFQALALYSWHCDHHLAHITELKKRSGW